jgi:hypothetical protein
MRNALRDYGQTGKENECAMRKRRERQEYGQQQKLESKRLYVIMLCLGTELRRVRWTTPRARSLSRGGGKAG